MLTWICWHLTYHPYRLVGSVSILMWILWIHLLSLLTSVLYHFPSFVVDFFFNSFEPPDLNLYGDTTLKPSPGWWYLYLTNASAFSLSHALYKSKVLDKSSTSIGDMLPFSASFLFTIAPISGILYGHSFTLLFNFVVGILGITSS